MKKLTGWTKKSYSAIGAWLDVNKRAYVEQILLDDGLVDEVNRLRTQKMMVWYTIMCEGCDAVGNAVVASVAKQAESELEKYAS